MSCGTGYTVCNRFNCTLGSFQTPEPFFASTASVDGASGEVLKTEYTVKIGSAHQVNVKDLSNICFEEEDKAFLGIF